MAIIQSIINPNINLQDRQLIHKFCTYLDSNYLDRGLCLWHSLRRFQPGAQLFVCCLDNKSYDVLNKLSIKGIVVVSLEELESQYPELLTAKQTRSRIEYYFTITPSWIRYIFDRYPAVEQVTYTDSDLYFFSDPQSLFNEMDEKSADVAIIAHRFSPALQAASIHGHYNVGWVTFRRSQNARNCLLDWQLKCIDWCYDRVEDGRFADQKYLDAWPNEHRGIVVLEHPGANVALWNLISGTIKSKNRRIQVYERELVFYHFHGLSQISPRIFFTNARMYHVALDPIVRHSIYGPYMQKLRKMQKILRRVKVQPLIRYKYSKEDIKLAKKHPSSGIFLYSLCGIALP